MLKCQQSVTLDTDADCSECVKRSAEQALRLETECRHRRDDHGSDQHDDEAALDSGRTAVELAANTTLEQRLQGSEGRTLDGVQT